MGPLGELGALFNPGMRHEIEERQAKANRREEEGNARDGDLRIDLASGVAVINLSKGGEHPAAPNGNGGAPAIAEPAEPEADDGTSPSEQAPAPSHQAADAAGQGSADGSDAPTANAHPAPPREGKPLTAAQARRLATAARRSASGDQPARTATPRPANAQLPSSKASRAAR